MELGTRAVEVRSMLGTEYCLVAAAVCTVKFPIGTYIGSRYLLSRAWQ